MSEEIIEDMPEFTKGFSDAPPKLLYDFSETTDPIEELTEEEEADEEYRTRNLRYDTEEFSEKISEWAEEIELGKIEYEDGDDEETEETVANDAIESLLTVARGAARALEKATQLRPEFSKNLMQASDDWPIIVSNSQVGWEEDGVPDQVWSTLKKLSKNPGKAKSSRLLAWVKASLRAIVEVNNKLSNELLSILHDSDPYHFEQIVLDVLVAMGYGGSRDEAAKVTKKSNDGGIDGIINEDRLGLDVIYVQAKRYKNNVGRVDVQNFVGALAGNQAHKGIFITTSCYNQNAIDYAQNIPQKIILIDGTRLANLMIEHNVGVSTEEIIFIKRLDTDYFEN
jgi:hypothetical protein